MSDLFAATPAGRLVEVASSLHCDGVDLDFEDEIVQFKSFENFVTKLRVAATAKNLLLSASFTKVAVEAHVSNEALDNLDYVNLRAYDYMPRKGSTPPPNPADYSFAEQELDYYQRIRGLPSGKLNLGLPMYGWKYL